jgi:hypothetical protein
MVVSFSVVAVWARTLCILVYQNRSLGSICCIHLQELKFVLGFSSKLNEEAARFSKPSVLTYQATRCHSPEDHNCIE